MKREGNARLFLLAALLLASLLAASALYLLLYETDNKYTAGGPQPQNGALALTESTLTEHPVLFLIRDWEIYRDKLLTPDDFITDPPAFDELVYIGQYGGLEGRVQENESPRSPHGSATYRLNIFLPGKTQSYTLELPEIYSAYRLYINGALMREMGEPGPQGYRAETGISSVTVRAADGLEILLAVSDHSHFYSGMVYPPAFGEPAAVAHMLGMRLALRALACAAALCIGVSYLLLGLFGGMRKESGKALPFLYAALCLAYTLYICYPVVKTLFWGGLFLHRLETLAYCAMLLLVLWIRDSLTGMERRYTGMFAAFGVFTCAAAVAAPLLMGSSLNLMIAYSRLIGLYTWVCAAYLTVGTAWSLYRGKAHGCLMLAGVAAFDAALIMDRLFPLFEPIRFGWFAELAGGVLVLCVGIAMARELAARLRLQQAVEARVGSVLKMLEVQRAYHPVLLEKEREIKAARHDLRHHVTMLRELFENGDMAGLRAYLDAYGDRRVPAAPLSYCRHYMTDMLLRMYAGLAAGQDTPFQVEAKLPQTLSTGDVDLCVILSNLLENALEASALLPAGRRDILVRIGCRRGCLVLLVENRFDGHVKTENGRFFSRKQNREGIGLASVRAVADGCGGSASFYAEGDVFYSEVFLPERRGVKNAEEAQT